MHCSLANILAATRSGGDGQWVVGVVVFAIWALLSVVGAATKKKEQQKRDQVRQTLENLNVPPAMPIRTTAAPVAQVRRTPALAPEIARRVPPAMKVRPAQSVSRTSAVAARGATPKKIAANIAAAVAAKAAPRAPALAASRATSTSASVPLSMTAMRPDIASSEIRSEGAPVARVPSTDAAALRRWLKPETLRQQFILTEILQPPLALRPAIGLTSHA